jgi:hypothetical protein
MCGGGGVGWGSIAGRLVVAGVVIDSYDSRHIGPGPAGAARKSRQLRCVAW